MIDYGLNRTIVVRGLSCFRLFMASVFLPVAIGTMIYLLFRPTNLTVFHWADAIGLYKYVIAVRDYTDISHLLPAWIIYSLPNGLWAFSFMFCISFIWGSNRCIEKLAFLLLVILLSVGSEMAQLFIIIPGTFCYSDVLFNSVGVISGYYCGQIYYWRSLKNEKN